LEVETTREELILNLCWGNPKECHYQWALPHSGRDRVIATAQNQPSQLYQ